MNNVTSRASQRFNYGYIEEFAKLASDDEKLDLKKMLMQAGIFTAGTTAGILLGEGIVRLMRRLKAHRLPKGL